MQKIDDSLSFKSFISDSLKTKRARVISGHFASIILGLTTGLLGFVVGPVMVGLFSPETQFLPWNQVIGPFLSSLLEAYLPADGLAPREFVNVLPVVLMSIASVKALMYFYQWFTWELIGEEIFKEWRSLVTKSFVSLSSESRDDGLSKSEEEKLGTLLSHDLKVLREYVVHFYGGLPREGLQVLFSAMSLLALSPKLFGIFVFCIAPIGAVLSRYGKKIRRRASKALSDNSILAEWIQQRILGIETIKHCGTESTECDRMKSASENLFERFKAAARLKSKTSPMIEAFGIIAMSVALWVAFNDIALGKVSGAVVMSFFTSLALFAQSAAKLGRYLNSNQDGKAAGQRVIEFLLQMNRYKASGSAQVILKSGSKTTLSVRNLSVSYVDGKSVLSDVNFDFLGGRIYCLVGKSGAGKSTLFNTLLGLRTQDKGEISASFDQKTFARANDKAEGSYPFAIDIVSIPQQIPSIPTSIARNISYPIISPHLENASKSLQLAQLNLSSERLREGMQTYVGTGGVQLSGGEFQRLQLARIYYHNSPFVFVDEGTSALDPLTEREVLMTLKDVARRGACVIMIAHRKAAALASDEVLLMDNGKIIASGHPSVLLEQKGVLDLFGG